MPDPTYRAGGAYAITGPCSMASPCPGPDAPREQHGAGCPLSATATLMQHETAPDVLNPDLAELRRLLGSIDYDGCEPLREWMMGHLAGRTHSQIVDGAVNALPALLDAAAERNALAAKVERVRALHQPCRCGSGNTHCDVCETLRYPCPTIDALDADRNEAGR